MAQTKTQHKKTFFFRCKNNNLVVVLGDQSKHSINTVKSFNFMGTQFRGLTTMDMFMDTFIHGLQII